MLNLEAAAATTAEASTTTATASTATTSATASTATTSATASTTSAATASASTTSATAESNYGEAEPNFYEPLKLEFHFFELCFSASFSIAMKCQLGRYFFKAGKGF